MAKQVSMNITFPREIEKYENDDIMTKAETLLYRCINQKDYERFCDELEQMLEHGRIYRITYEDIGPA